MNERAGSPILIIKLAALGDVLRTTCLLRPLKHRYADARITWLTQDNAVDLLKNNPKIDRLLTSDENTRRRLAAQHYDLIVNLEEDQDSCRLTSRAESVKKVGGLLDSQGRPCYTADAEPWFGMGLLRPPERGGLNEANRLKAVNKRTYQQIVLGILGLPAVDTELILGLDRGNREFAYRFAQTAGVSENDLVIGLNTSAGGRWPMKSLSPEKTADLAGRLISRLGARIVLFGGGQEAARNRQIVSTCAGIIDAGTENSLLDYAALIGLCDILITSDSLALHIGTALKVKIVAFFGPTSAAEIDLYGRGRKIVSKSEYYCTYRKDDPLGEGIPGVEVADIMAEVRELL